MYFVQCICRRFLPILYSYIRFYVQGSSFKFYNNLFAIIYKFASDTLLNSSRLEKTRKIKYPLILSFPDTTQARISLCNHSKANAPPPPSPIWGRSGGHKEMSLSWLTNSAFVYEPKCGGLWGLSQRIQLCPAHGAQINFGDLTPYLTYGECRD